MYAARRLPYGVPAELVTAASAGERRTAEAAALQRARQSFRDLAQRREAGRRRGNSLASAVSVRCEAEGATVG